MTPYVTESTSTGERTYDLFSRMLKDRVIFLNGPINSSGSQIVVTQLLYLESVDPNADISLYINSGGGEVTAGLSIYDTMRFIKSDVSTIVMGQACSMGSLLASSGTKGKRFILPSARHMVHQVSSGTQGTAIDMKIQLEETLRLNKYLTEIYVSNTGKPYSQLENDMARDFYMDASESLEYGLCDEIVINRK